MRNNRSTRPSNADKETILTAAGLRRVEEELDQLRGSRRKEIAERIRMAKEFGDLSENAEYDDAKNEQAFVEGRILQLEHMVRSARVIDSSAAAGDAVSAGATVLLKDLATGAELRYTIVGSPEADPLLDLISNESPVGEALIGRRKGETVKVRVPAGEFRYKILEIVQ